MSLTDAVRTATANKKGRVFSCHLRPARYSGAYSGARWHAWPVKETARVPDDAYGSDPACASFWRNRNESGIPMVGRGADPNEALEDLRKQLRDAGQHIGSRAPDRKPPEDVPGLAWYHNVDTGSS